MSEQLEYNTIEKPSFAEYKEKASRFLAYAYPLQTIDDFKQYLQLLKKQHPKAAHHCFAYRLGLDGNNFRTSDNGEPAGTAGKPILGQIDSKQLINVLVVIVRYFGGTLLGVPSLINAYKTSAALALQLTPVVKKHVMIKYILLFNYSIMNEVMLVVKQFSCEIITQENLLFCQMEIGIPKRRTNAVLLRLKELKSVEIRDKN